MMDRAEILNTMAALKLFGMKAGCDEIVAAMPKARLWRDREAGA